MTCSSQSQLVKWYVHGRWFPYTWLTNQVRKVMCGGGAGVVACKIIVSAPVPVRFLRTLDLDLGLRTWTWAWQTYIFINVYKCQIIFLSLKLNWQPWKLLSVNRLFETSIKCEDKFAIDFAVIDIFSAPPLIFMLRKYYQAPVTEVTKQLREIK